MPAYLSIRSVFIFTFPCSAFIISVKSPTELVWGLKHTEILVIIVWILAKAVSRSSPAVKAYGLCQDGRGYGARGASYAKAVERMVPGGHPTSNRTRGRCQAAVLRQGDRGNGAWGPSYATAVEGTVPGCHFTPRRSCACIAECISTQNAATFPLGFWQSCPQSLSLLDHERQLSV